MPSSAWCCPAEYGIVRSTGVVRGRVPSIHGDRQGKDYAVNGRKDNIIVQDMTSPAFLEKKIQREKHNSW